MRPETPTKAELYQECDQLRTENAKLREELADARQIMADELEKQISDYRTRHIEQVRTITELESENAELREDNDRLIEAIEELHSVSLEDRLVQLENDNDKLRELVRKVERFERIGCHECPHAGCGADTLYDDDCPMRREIEQDKRELGIDIEEGE